MTSEALPLHDQVALLRVDIAELKRKIYGDLEAQKKYDDSKRTGLTASYPGPQFVEPPPGLDQQLAQLAEIVDTHGNEIDSRLSHLATGLDKLLANHGFVQKLEALFAPMVSELKGNPLSTEQIATRTIVDNQIALIARTLRQEMKEKSEETAARVIPKLNQAYDFARAIIEKLGAFDMRRDNTVNTSWLEVARKLALVWEREQKLQDAETGQTSRLQSLAHAILGVKK